MLTSEWETSSHNDLVEKKRTWQSRLDEIGVGDAPRRSTRTKAACVDGIPYSPKADTHWDFVMKEMMWLGADFQGERKRQLSLAKKCASSVKQHHKTKETRKLKELQNAIAKRRKTGAKVGRDVKNWWSKIERVISYKQKLEADEKREKAMNKQLVLLVQQTERYSASLTGCKDADTSDSDDNPKRYNKNSTKRRKSLTIEAALAMERKRKSKERVRDYARMKLEHAEFYGESTLSDTGSDGSYEAESDTDDESTIKAAMDDELLFRGQDSSVHGDYQADPFELLRLREEAEMEINQLVGRLESEGDPRAPVEKKRSKNLSDRGKQVRFQHEEIVTAEKEVAGGVSDEPVVNDETTIEGETAADMENEEYQPTNEDEVDDETTVAAEERLGREMSYEEELALLKRENLMSVEELRAIYTGSNQSDYEERKSEEVPISLSDASAADVENEEYQPMNEDEVDDEATLAAEERLDRDMSYEEELALLKRENEISVEELRAIYTGSNQSDNEVSKLEEAPNSLFRASMHADVENEEYQPMDEDEVDDETTLAAEERLDRDMSSEEELALLKRENEMSVEALRAMYATRSSPHQPDDEESQAIEAVSPSSCADFNRTVDDPNHLQRRSSQGEHDRAQDERSTLEEGEKALCALEASAARARTTLASRPFLLASWVKLRKYQQVGLNWLVSLQTRSLNGILADEMGLGKTLQTISLLSYLASYKGIWGPHLVVVPTSVIINWETELKRFCPALKVLCYYGSAKRRKELRTGWTQTNWYHVVITSYQLAVQDAFAFKRKKWYYLILDEAQNIKNFQSQRWQTLINFNTRRRLLLTGTPLQNTLMELWSLLHFLMPYIFRSRKEFSYWFSNPMNSIIEGKTNGNDEIIKKLHGIIRPFVLRRLKKDVETQMPGKFEHIVKCQLSRRQMQLYEEFLSRSSTRLALKSGANFMGMMNVLMQLRKVCNHPDLFEPRSIMTPFVVPGVRISLSGSVCCILPHHNMSFALSEYILKPLWSRNRNTPAPKTTQQISGQESYQLDTKDAIGKIQSSKPFVYNSDESPDELRTLIEEISAARKDEKASRVQFQKAVNSHRCAPSLSPFPRSLIDTVDVDVDIFGRLAPVEVTNRDILSTPTDLLKLRSLERQRADQFDDSIDKFVVCVPKVGASAPIIETTGSLPYEFSNHYQKHLKALLEGPLEAAMQPYRKAHARLSAFFPDKKLVQYDAGKLQKLAELLRDLKQGGHRALIFTQMSKMLDILEAFLNIHGHTYLRLDGSTGIDRRQRFMDRFNNDEKLFCFILSTRSGGMGINLTGADSVIFYDSDWNPAMDAQAQDRAHRIGQTREVHIYRLVTEHTIEENILIKAKQKKNLDIMVMDQGKFDASSLYGGNGNQVKDVYTNDGLCGILGVNADKSLGLADVENAEDTGKISNEQMEKAMASLEDDDDVQALRGARLEAAEELKEFDDTAEVKEDVENRGLADFDNKDAPTVPPAKRRKLKQRVENDEVPAEQISSNHELERDFATWRSTVGLDAAAINGALAPMERYALSFREDIDPFFSSFHNSEESHMMEVEQFQDNIDIQEIERMKSFEEWHAMDVGDLLGTHPQPESLIRQRNLYQRERMRQRSEKKRRQQTGESWFTKIDGLTKTSFWYNSDTGEALWNKPTVLIQIEEYNVALQKGWGFLPLETLVGIMDYLVPFPERQKSASVCRQWKGAAKDIRFVRHVYPVEMGAISRETKRLHNHYGTLAEVLTVAMPGDTIELADGHYWVSEPGLVVKKPLKFVGDENNPSNVIIEISGSLVWKAKSGWMEGITLRRPKITASPLVPCPILKVPDTGRVDINNCVFDNNKYEGSVMKLSGSGSKGSWSGIQIRNGGWHGIEMDGNIDLNLKKCFIVGNGENGIKCSGQSMLSVCETRVKNNHGFALEFRSGTRGEISKCFFDMNRKGILLKEPGCPVACRGNAASVSKPPEKSIPGFTINVL